MGIQIQDVGGVRKASRLIVNGVVMTRTWVYRLVAEWWFAALVVRANPTIPSSTRTPPYSGVDHEAARR